MHFLSSKGQKSVPVFYIFIIFEIRMFHPYGDPEIFTILLAFRSYVSKRNYSHYHFNQIMF